MYNSKMSVFTGLSWLLTCASLICVCNCQDSLVSVIHKLNQFEEDLLDNKADMLRIEKRVLNIIDVTKTSLRAELKETIRRQVKKFQNETDVFQGSALKKVDIWNGEDSSSVCVRDKHRLESELHQCDAYNVDLKADNDHLVKLIEKYQSQISQLTTTVAVLSSSQAPQHLNSTSRSTWSTTPVTTTKSSVATPKPQVLTTSLTTPRPSLLPATTFRSQNESRILIAPLESNTGLHFRQLSIPSNNLSIYKYHAMDWVTTLAYIAKTNKLLIGLYSPNKIMSSTLDTSNVTVLMEGVYATSMAVDDGRDIIFMSTYRPHYSISRMSTQGEDFTNIVDLSGYGGIPRQITLDTRKKRIYGCNGGKLFTVTYDGHGLGLLVTGSRMHAVTLDQAASVLYYTVQKKLMKWKLSRNLRTEVTRVNVLPWNVEVHRGIIYISGLYPSTIDVVSYNTGKYSLQSIDLDFLSQVTMCLIP